LRISLLVSVWVAVAGCAAAGCAAAGAPAASSPDDAPARVTRLANEYVAAYFERFPESATRRGLASSDHGAVLDNSLEAVAAWRAREDAWLAEVRAIHPRDLEGGPEWATYGILREALEGSVAVRVCREELWTVSSGPSGWQAGYSTLAGLQPTGTDTLRAQAVSRVGGLARYIDTEIGNLRRGVRQGYTAPRVIVEATIRQMDGILSAAADSSPFFAPARRDSTPGFAAELARAIERELYPAVRRYRDFLAGEYRDAARIEIGVASIPNGPACYRAVIRRFTTLDLSPEEVFRDGEREMAAIRKEMLALAERSFGTSDLRSLLRRLREDTAFTYRTREEIVAASAAAIERARIASPKWFGLLPAARVEIRQHPEFRQREGAVAQYSSATEDGSRPGVFWISTYRPEAIPRAYGEATAFHEGIPGHHLQGTIAQERKDAHPITRYFFSSGFGEGWALYSEGLADEMGLYSSDIARMGLLASQAWRAARLVIDAGVHARGWRRERAVEYLAGNTTMSPVQLQGEVDRYISWPGQATSYMLGNLEIRALRSDAERRLGSRFEIREFHDRVLENGAVTLPMLRQQVERWLNRVGRD
jgi:uncharacterized protein (DUF885 family)